MCLRSSGEKERVEVNGSKTQAVRSPGDPKGVQRGSSSPGKPLSSGPFGVGLGTVSATVGGLDPTRTEVCETIGV